MAGRGGVYTITHSASGRRYVGSARNLEQRWRDHRNCLKGNRHHSRYLQHAWNKHGEDAFTFEVVLYCDQVNLLMYEQALIDFYKPEFNSRPTAASQIGFRHTEESKRQISANRKGKGGGPRTPERLAKIGAAHRGRPKSAEQRARIAATLTGRVQSAETIEKRVQQLRGRKYPPEYGAAISARMLGSKLSEETKQKVAKAASRLTDEQVVIVRELLAGGERQRLIAAQFSVDPSVISEIKCGKSYRWVS